MQDSHHGLDDQDESVRIAVRALDDMRNSAVPRLDIGASRTLPPLSALSSSSAGHTHPDVNSPAFVARMSHLPFVNSALRVYEQGKASSRMVKYGAEMMESSVKTISRPVINRLPVDVNQLDEFACRQLDRLDLYRRPSGSASRRAISPDPSNTDRETEKPKFKSKSKTLDGSALEVDDNSMQRHEMSARISSSESRRPYGREGDRSVPGWLEGNSSPSAIPPPPLPPPTVSRSSTPTQNGDDSRPSEKSDSHERQVAQRSRWQAVLLEAGGLSAALSEESMRRLKYCLQWLQYATAYIDAHILFLRNFTADLQPLPSDNNNTPSTTRRPPISEEHMRRLMDVRRDIVHTIRQVVDIVSKYAGGALPEPAKTRVRGFILTLPQRWASKAGGTAGGGSAGGERDSKATVAAASGTGAIRRPGGQRRAAHRERGTGSIGSIDVGGGGGGGLISGASSRAPSPSSSPRVGGVSRATHLRHGSCGEVNGEGGGAENGRVPAGTALVAAQRILALATESLDMMRNVTAVMKDSLDRAEAWVSRLRTVGIQRGQQQEGEDGTDMTSEYEFATRNSNNSRRSHRRHQHHPSLSSQFSEQDDNENDNEMIEIDITNSSSSSSASITSLASTTVWGSSNTGASTPACGGGGASAMMVIPIGNMRIGAMPRKMVLGIGDEEEEEEEEGVLDKREGVGNRKKKLGVVGGVEGEQEKGLGMDVDVDV